MEAPNAVEAGRSVDPEQMTMITTLRYLLYLLVLNFFANFARVFKSISSTVIDLCLLARTSEPA